VIVIFDAHTTQIRHFSARPRETDEANRADGRRIGLSREVAQQRMREYMAILQPGTEQELFISENHGTEWEFQGYPKVGTRELNYPSSWSMNIDNDRGQLNSYYGGSIPDLELAQAPVCDARIGQASACEAYSRFKPFEHGRIRATWLTVGVASFRDLNEMTDEHRQLAKARKAIPLYLTHIDDVDSLDPETGNYGRFQIAYVDARDGHAIGFVEQFFLGSGPKDAAKKSIWESSKPIEIAGQSGLLFLTRATQARVSAPEEVPIVVKQNKDLWIATFSSATGSLTAKSDSSAWSVPKQATKKLKRIAEAKRAFRAR